MLLKLFAKYRTGYYPRALQSLVVLMRYLAILALISLIFEAGSKYASDVFLSNEVLTGLIVTTILIPICMSLRVYVMRCGTFNILIY